jgi:exodeoxyribonuclease-3
VKVATFNINNINKRLDNLLAWLAKAEPDVVSLQELKAEQGEFPVNALRTLGYEAVWQGERSGNGVAILARNHVPVLTCTSLPGNPEDRQARYIEAAVQGILITSIYLPNGNPQPGPKFNYKLAWFERLIAHAAELMASGAPVVLAGDYNVVPTPHDIYPTRSLDNNALIQPESRQAFARLLAQGWTAMRKLGRSGHSGITNLNGGRRTQQRKELQFPARLCIRVNSHSQFDAVHPSADLSSPLLSVKKPLATHSPMQSQSRYFRSS